MIRRFLLIALLLCLPIVGKTAISPSPIPVSTAGGGGPAYVGSCLGAGPTGATCTVDLTGANFLAIAVTLNGHAGTAGDSLGTTYTLLSNTGVPGPGCGRDIYNCLRYAYVSPVSGNVTFSVVGCTLCSIVGAGYSGMIGTTLDQTVPLGDGTGIDVCTPFTPITPSFNNELILTSWSPYTSVTGGTISIDSGFNLRQWTTIVPGDHYSLAFADIIQTTAGSVQPIWTNPGIFDSTETCFIGTFQ